MNPDAPHDLADPHRSALPGVIDRPLGARRSGRAGSIDRSAVIGRGVQIGRGVTIGPYAVVGDRVRIGDRFALGSHAVLRSGSVLGAGTTVESFAVVGGDPQAPGFDPATRSGVRIGDDVTIREGVTIHRSTCPDGYTVVDHRSYLMVNSHVGHDCHVGRHAVLANNVMLAGHVDVGAHAVLGGGAGVHQFTRIGDGAMIAGNASVSYDVPPFMLVAERNLLIGLNVVGLRRRAYSVDDLLDLKRCLRTLFGSPGDVRLKAEDALADGVHGVTDSGRRFLRFCCGGSRGFVRFRRERPRDARDDR